VIRNLKALMVVGVGVFLAGSLWAKDPLEVGPTIYKVLHENERARLMEVTFKPGEKIGEHSHPDHLVYVLEGGKLKISKPDGTSSDFDLQPGQAVWIPRESHSAENIGATRIRLTVTEFKDASMPAAKPSTKTKQPR
jgi:beta-alanine degradation protein BauB